MGAGRPKGRGEEGEAGNGAPSCRAEAPPLTQDYNNHNRLHGSSSHQGGTHGCPGAPAFGEGKENPPIPNWLCKLHKERDSGLFCSLLFPQGLLLYTKSDFIEIQVCLPRNYLHLFHFYLNCVITQTSTKNIHKSGNKSSSLSW